MIWALHQHNSMLRSVRNGNSEQEEIERWRELMWYLGRNPSSHKLVLNDGSISRPLDLHNMLLNRRSPTHRHVSYMCVLSNYTVYVNTYGQCMQIIVLYRFYCCKYRLYGRVRIEYLSICYVPVSALHSSWHGLRKPVWKTLMTHFIPAWIYSNPQKASCFSALAGLFQSLSATTNVQWGWSRVTVESVTVARTPQSSSGSVKAPRCVWAHYPAAVWMLLHKDANQEVQHVSEEWSSMRNLLDSLVRLGFISK